MGVLMELGALKRALLAIIVATGVCAALTADAVADTTLPPTITADRTLDVLPGDVANAADRRPAAEG